MNQKHISPDELDLKILEIFCRLKEDQFTTISKISKSTWRIMKKIFPNGREYENNKIKRRIERMANHKLFIVEGNPKTYTLNSDKVCHKKFNFSTRKSFAIEILINGKFEVFEI